MTTSVQSEEKIGVLHLFSETGTEGGHWAFQDHLFVRKDVPRGFCKICGYAMKKHDVGPLSVKKQVKITEEGMAEYIETGEYPEPEKCKPGECEEDIGDSWSYEGLNILENGDYLTIYSKENPEEIVWEGEINLNQHDLFTEHASGWWIHADQIGIDRDEWATFFLDAHEAKLRRNTSAQ